MCQLSRYKQFCSAYVRCVAAKVVNSVSRSRLKLSLGVELSVAAIGVSSHRQMVCIVGAQALTTTVPGPFPFGVKDGQRKAINSGDALGR